MTPEQRKQNFVAWMQQGEAMFGATVTISQTITPMPNGGFAYTPPVLTIATIEGWEPPAPPEEGKPE